MPQLLLLVINKTQRYSFSHLDVVTCTIKSVYHQQMVNLLR